MRRQNYDNLFEILMQANTLTITELLEKLVYELKVANLWSVEQPDAQQLASTQPFCIDTLAFEQWLQFIFLPRIQHMIKNKQALPSSIALCPMAEEAFVKYGDKAAGLINILGDIDEALSGNRQQTRYINHD